MGGATKSREKNNGTVNARRANCVQTSPNNQPAHAGVIFSDFGSFLKDLGGANAQRGPGGWRPLRKLL